MREKKRRHKDSKIETYRKSKTDRRIGRERERDRNRKTDRRTRRL